jgi:hypothetical protein
MSGSYRKSWRAVAAGVLLIFISLAGVVGWRASRALRVATQEVRSESEIRFTVRPYSEPQEQDFETVSTPAVFLQAAQFFGDLYIAGPAGLSQYSASGTLLKHYAVGQDLPSSQLVAMAPAMLADGPTALLPKAGQLFVGSEDQGVVAIPLTGRRRTGDAPSDASPLAAVPHRRIEFGCHPRIGCGHGLPAAGFNLHGLDRFVVGRYQAS